MLEWWYGFNRDRIVYLATQSSLVRKWTNLLLFLIEWSNEVKECVLFPLKTFWPKITKNKTKLKRKKNAWYIHVFIKDPNWKHVNCFLIIILNSKNTVYMETGLFVWVWKGLLVWYNSLLSFSCLNILIPMLVNWKRPINIMFHCMCRLLVP
jgi:hypothetical protein